MVCYPTISHMKWLVHPIILSKCVARSIFLPFLLRLLKRWFGPDTVTEGAVLRRRFEQDKRRRELEAEAAKIRGWVGQKGRLRDRKEPRNLLDACLEGPRNMGRMIWFQDVGWQLMVKHSAYSALSQRSGDLIKWSTGNVTLRSHRDVTGIPHWHFFLAYKLRGGSTAPIVQCLEHQKMHSFNVEKAPLNPFKYLAPKGCCTTFNFRMSQYWMQQK